MSTSEWIQLIIPVVSIVAAIISAALTYFFSRRLQISNDEKRLKEKYYQDYIDAISNVAIDNYNDNAKTELANAHNTITLVGSAKVVQLTMKFHTYIIDCQKNNSTAKEHDIILTDLVKAMREDLYNSKKINKEYPTIHLSGLGSRGKKTNET